MLHGEVTGELGVLFLKATVDPFLTKVTRDSNIQDESHDSLLGYEQDEGDRTMMHQSLLNDSIVDVNSSY